MISEAEQARRVVRATFWTRFFVVFVTTALVGTMALLAVLALQDNQRIEQNRNIQSIIRDCVTPSGKCYRDGQSRTAQAVGDINRVVILAAACAADMDAAVPVRKRIEVITNCVTDRLG